MWLEYYKHPTVVQNQGTYNLCKSHYVSMRQIASNRSCHICPSTSSQWHTGQSFFGENRITNM